MEGQVRDKKGECDRLKKENKNIRKWIKQNEKDKANINENGFYDEESSKLKTEYKKDKAKIREMYYETLKKRKALIERHDIVVKLENSIRKMKELIETTRRDKSEAKKHNLDIAKPEAVVQGKEWDVDEMKKKVDTAKASLYRQQNNIEKETSRQEEEIKRIEHEIKLLKIKVKEKDKELSLANLKIKELKRNLRYTALKPLDTVSVKQQFYLKNPLLCNYWLLCNELFELVKSFPHNLNHTEFSNFIVKDASTPQTPGQYTSRKKKVAGVYRSIDGTIIKKRGPKKHPLAGKRNSTDNTTGLSSNK